MPVARFQMPDGRIGRFEVPDGTTPEQAQSLIQTHLNESAPPRQPSFDDAPNAVLPLTAEERQAQTTPEPNLWQKSRPYVMPVVEGAAMTAGGLLGGAAGVVTSPTVVANPVTGAIAGAGLGYAGARQLGQLADQYLGGQAPQTLGEQAKGAALDVAKGAGMEVAGQGILAPIVARIIPPVMKAAGWVYDQAGGRAVQIKGGKILREIAGDKLDEISAALSNAKPGVTAGQAVAEGGVNAPTFQAMQQRAATQLPEQFGDIAEGQAAQRAADLKRVTPNADTATQVRDMVSDIGYDRLRTLDKARLDRVKSFEKAQEQLKGTGASVVVPPRMSPEIAALRNTSATSNAIRAAEDTVRGMRDDLPNPMESFEGLEAMKKALDSRIKEPNVDNALKNYDSSLIAAARARLIKAMETQSPLYGQIRAGHARLSGPVNQGNVLDDLANVLANPASSPGKTLERPGPFLNAMTTGAERLMKRSGVPRFQRGDVSQVLTGEQNGVVENVANQLRRDISMGGQAVEGKNRLNEILGDSRQAVQLPPTLTRTGAIINKVLSVMSGRVNTQTLRALSEAMQSGKSTLELMNTVPTHQRQALLRAIQETQGSLGGTGATVNALAGGQ